MVSKNELIKAKVDNLLNEKKLETLYKFNDILNVFLSQMGSIFDDSILETLKNICHKNSISDNLSNQRISSFKFIKEMNMHIPGDPPGVYITNYIIDEDESLFNEEKNVESLELFKALNLKNKWKTLNDINKKNVWMYIKRLHQIGIECEIIFSSGFQIIFENFSIILSDKMIKEKITSLRKKHINEMFENKNFVGICNKVDETNGWKLGMSLNVMKTVI